MSTPRTEQPTPAPSVGKVYRDAANRSLVVRAIRGDKVTVEYADGAVKSLTQRSWLDLEHRDASF